MLYADATSYKSTVLVDQDYLRPFNQHGDKPLRMFNPWIRKSHKSDDPMILSQEVSLRALSSNFTIDT